MPTMPRYLLIISVVLITTIYFGVYYESPITSYELKVEAPKRDPRMDELLQKKVLTEEEFTELKALSDSLLEQYKKSADEALKEKLHN